MKRKKEIILADPDCNSSELICFIKFQFYCQQHSFSTNVPSGFPYGLNSLFYSKIINRKMIL